ncbi:MAG: hypothetical protein ACYDHX_10230 [Methanothrix sp.]
MAVSREIEVSPDFWLCDSQGDAGVRVAGRELKGSGALVRDAGRCSWRPSAGTWLL